MDPNVQMSQMQQAGPIWPESNVRPMLSTQKPAKNQSHVGKMLGSAELSRRPNEDIDPIPRHVDPSDTAYSSDQREHLPHHGNQYQSKIQAKLYLSVSVDSFVDDERFPSRYTKSKTKSSKLQTIPFQSVVRSHRQFNLHRQQISNHLGFRR
jgi:hypothetical protein